MKTARKTWAWLAAVLLVAVLAGCGTKEAEKPTKEFASSDGVVSVMLAEDWKSEDAGVDGWIGAVSKDERDGIVVAQFVKGVDAVGLVDIKNAFEDTYSASEITEEDGSGLVPGMENIQAYRCKMTVEV